ncbi:MAG: lipoyl(octanoyl) transferase LipB [Chitinophagaceae bacterium]|nr:lipoyl(octanoyl) transferase LipB [Chitinophagaceae bacterium]OQY93068.1 MAG: lipoyl(octanoyl) transferase [Sphingobacteriales bacterium UTBCD1]
MNRQKVIFQDLGLCEYKKAWDYQEQLLGENVRRKSIIRNLQLAADKSHLPEGYAESEQDQPEHYLLFVEHPPVYTLGKNGNTGNLLINEEERTIKGIEYFHTNRGGDITFHGAQQIVGYPILDLEKFETDIGIYLNKIEEVIIRTLADYGINGNRSPGETGVWIEPEVKGKERKICAIGVRTSRWITMHGFAFNVNTDLRYFDFIIPCGISNKRVTSLEKELGYQVDMEEVKMKVKRHFEKVFDVELISED